jgi:RimJ/RimL family protein N-acetyltransferase
MREPEPPITIRETTEADLPALVALWNDGRVMGWVGHPDGLGLDLGRARKWWDRLRAEPHRHHFVIDVEKMGFAGELYYRVERHRRRAALDIKLRAEAHGRGIARAALLALCDRVWADESDVDAVWVEPSAENAAARRLYARCGFVPTDRPADLPPGDSYWELRRPIETRGPAGPTSQAGTASSSGAVERL